MKRNNLHSLSLRFIDSFIDLFALGCGVYCDFVTFPFGILGQRWYQIVSILDPCYLSTFIPPLLTLITTYLVMCKCYTDEDDNPLAKDSQ